MSEKVKVMLAELEALLKPQPLPVRCPRWTATLEKHTDAERLKNAAHKCPVVGLKILLLKTMVVIFLRLLLCSFVMKGTAVKVLATIGGQASLPCRYEYEEAGAIEELSVQWKGPQQQLLCHFVKHKSFRNCTPGYDLIYTPGRITLVIGQVAAEDAGSHVCSVSKRHTFSDFVAQLSLRTRSTGPHLLLLSCVLLVCFWG
ncbi:uncharacterized protein LOC111846276 [Arapaima gigas]